MQKTLWLWSCHLGQAVSRDPRRFGDVSVSNGSISACCFYNDVVGVDNAIMSRFMLIMADSCVNHVKVGRPVQKMICERLISKHLKANKCWQYIYIPHQNRGSSYVDSHNQTPPSCLKPSPTTTLSRTSLENLVTSIVPLLPYVNIKMLICRHILNKSTGPLLYSSPITSRRRSLRPRRWQASS